MVDKRERQVLGEIERIHSRVRYLEGKRELRKYKEAVEEFEKEYQ